MHRVNGGELLLLLRLHEVHRLGADHPDDRPVKNHPPSQKNRGVYPPDGGKFKQAAVGDIGDDQPDLIHMRVEHQPHLGAFFALFKNDQIAGRVDPRFGRPANLLLQKIAEAVLFPRRGFKPAETFQYPNHAMPPPFA